MKIWRKFRLTRAQVNIMSAVLITAILLAAVAGTYIWAQPIMVKASDKRRIDYAKDMLDNIRKAIEAAAFQQQQKVIPVEYDKGTLKISKDSETDEYIIDYQIETSIPMLASTAWVPLIDQELPIQENAKFVRSWCPEMDHGSNPPTCNGGGTGGDGCFCETYYESSSQKTIYQIKESCNDKISGDRAPIFYYSKEPLKIGSKSYKAFLCGDQDNPSRHYVTLAEDKGTGLSTGEDLLKLVENQIEWKQINGRFEQLDDLKSWQVKEVHRRGDTSGVVRLRLFAGYIDKIGEKGTNAPCVIIAKSLSRSQQRTAQLRIKCRPVIDAQDNIAYDIKITPGDVTLAPHGEHKITINYMYDKTLPPQQGQHWTTQQIFTEVAIT